MATPVAATHPAVIMSAGVASIHDARHSDKNGTDHDGNKYEETRHATFPFRRRLWLRLAATHRATVCRMSPRESST